MLLEKKKERKKKRDSYAMKVIPELVISSVWAKKTRVDLKKFQFPGMDNHVPLSIQDLMEALQLLQASDND